MERSTLTAKEAREITTQVLNETSSSIDEVLSIVKATANIGEFSCNIELKGAHIVNLKTIQDLKSIGYTVNIVDKKTITVLWY